MEFPRRRVAGWSMPSLALGLAACAWALTQPLTGVVIDTSTGQGLADVVVVASWEGDYGVVDKARHCAHVESARTDAQGRFILPGAPAGLGADTRYKSRDLDGCKKGYRVAADSDANGTTARYPMKPDPESAGDRFRAVVAEFREPLSEGCGDEDGSHENLHGVPVREMAEMRHPAHTEAQKKELLFLEARLKLDLVNPGRPTHLVDDLLLGSVPFNVDPNDAFEAEDLPLK